MTMNDTDLRNATALAEHLAIGARIVAAGIENPRSEAVLLLFMEMARGAQT